MSKQQLSSQNKTSIIVAIVGVIGSITVAYFAFLGDKTPVELSIGATQTAESNKTLAPSIFTSTPEKTSTEILPTSTSTIIPQQNFSTNCINATDWTPSPENTSFKKENNCWNLSSSGIAAQNGELFFAVQNDIPQTSSLYMPIPKEGIIKFNVNVDTFASGGTNGNLVFGVGTVDGWLTEGEFVFFRATNSGYYIVYGNSVIDVGKRTINNYELGSDVVVTFQFNNLVFDIYIDNTKIVSNIPLPSSNPQVFWIGYRLQEDSKFVASVSEFRVER